MLRYGKFLASKPKLIGKQISSTPIETMATEAFRSLTIKYWPVNEVLVFPESDMLKDKADVGVSLSGGGVRAAVVAVGWLQVLHELKVLHKVKYVSSISGGSWTSAPMSNCESDMDAFLAKIVPPEECSIQKMNEFATATNSHVKALTEVQFSSQLVGNYLRKIPQSIATTVKHYLGFKQTPDEDFWAHTVGKCFFQCHGIDHTSGLLHRPNIPYPIVNGSIIVGGKRGAIPVEFTPLYHGTPVSHDDIDAVYVEPKGFKAIIEKSTVSLTPSTNPLQGSTVTVKVIDDVQPLTCNEISGISSAAIAEMLGGMSNVAYDLLNFPEHQYFTNGVKKFNDGGTTDCTGTLALIRRSVTKIIACLACNDAITSPTITDANASCYGTLAGLFGTQKSSSEIDRVSNEDYNKFRQVFEREKWDELIAALKEKDLQGI